MGTQKVIKSVLFHVPFVLDIKLANTNIKVKLGLKVSGTVHRVWAVERNETISNHYFLNCILKSLPGENLTNI